MESPTVEIITQDQLRPGDYITHEDHLYRVQRYSMEFKVNLVCEQVDTGEKKFVVVKRLAKTGGKESEDGDGREPEQIKKVIPVIKTYLCLHLNHDGLLSYLDEDDNVQTIPSGRFHREIWEHQLKEEEMMITILDGLEGRQGLEGDKRVVYITEVNIREK